MSTTFTSLGVPESVSSALAKRGITEPFEIQTISLPDALAGRDLCGRAPTGSGKTLAFGIPLMSRVAKARPRHPRGLVLAPTRELAAQVHAELEMIGRSTGRTSVAVYGGVGFERQLNALRRGVDVVVATPGRLADLVARRAVMLDEVSIVVIDEADRMADMGFLPEVRRLLDTVTPDRQTMLFSATLDGDVDALVRNYQRNPVRHDIIGSEDQARLVHHFWRVETNERVALCASIVRQLGSTVVFCRTKRGADRVGTALDKAGVSVSVVHGDRSQAQRERALSAFARGQVLVLVATDVAARGIHVDAVRCVVHFDLPADAKDYLHRSGRTGRAGLTGVVVSLVSGSLAGEARKIQNTLGLPTGLVAPDLGSLDPDAAGAAAPGPALRLDRPVPSQQRPAANANGARRTPRSGRPASSAGRPSSGAPRRARQPR